MVHGWPLPFCGVDREVLLWGSVCHHVKREASRFILSTLTIAVRDAAMRTPGRQVATVGHLEVTPNSPNAIPGLVRLSLELCDLSPQTLASMADDIRPRPRELETTTRTPIEFKRLAAAAPAAATPQVQRAIERAAAPLRLDSTRVRSGAGHAAQVMARLGPRGMIFVPSVRGVSPSPKELTHWDDCANAANGLLRAVLEMDGVA